MKDNPRSQRAADLKAAAVRTLTEPITTFEVKPWREIMKNSAQIQKTKEVRAAAKKVAQKTPPYKHKASPPELSGVDIPQLPAVESGFSVFNQVNQGDSTMTTKTNDPTEKARASAEAAAAKAAKTKAAIEAKEKANAEKKAKKEAAAQAKADVAAQAKAEKAAAREARAAASTDKIMSSLRDRVKSGTYVKSTTGQMRSTDDIAEVFDAVLPQNVVKVGMILFNEPNKYGDLNVGQQSMNYRNRLRGAVRKGTEVNGMKITLDSIRDVITNNGFTFQKPPPKAKPVKATEDEAAQAS